MFRKWVSKMGFGNGFRKRQHRFYPIFQYRTQAYPCIQPHASTFRREDGAIRKVFTWPRKRASRKSGRNFPAVRFWEADRYPPLSAVSQPASSHGHARPATRSTSSGWALSAGSGGATSLHRSSPFTVTFYRQGNQNASGDGQDQDAPMPNQDMGRVLIDTAELQHRESKKTGDGA